MLQHTSFLSDFRFLVCVCVITQAQAVFCATKCKNEAFAFCFDGKNVSGIVTTWGQCSSKIHWVEVTHPPLHCVVGQESGKHINKQLCVIQIGISFKTRTHLQMVYNTNCGSMYPVYIFYSSFNLNLFMKLVPCPRDLRNTTACTSWS